MPPLVTRTAVATSPPAIRSMRPRTDRTEEAAAPAPATIRPTWAMKKPARFQESGSRREAEARMAAPKRAVRPAKGRPWKMSSNLSRMMIGPKAP